MKLAHLGRSAGALVLAAVAVATLPQEAGAEPQRVDYLDGKRTASGADAVRLLGTDLAAVARANGLGAAELREELLHDRTMSVTDNGRLTYTDPADTGQVSTTNTLTTPVFPTSQTFSLHTNPSSPFKIYLDFNGHTTSGTDWNYYWTSNRSFTSGAYDLDGYPGSFSQAEHAAMQAVWLHVREDFAPFNVDVTTQDPGLEGLRRTSTSDGSYGTRVVISPTVSWYPNAANGSAGGVAYRGSFGEVTSSYDEPVYVFTKISGAPKSIGEGASHESGHALGLKHDGTTSKEYYGGSDNWVPIMGFGPGKPVSQWSRGEYAGANNREDDLTVIASRVGWSYDAVPNAVDSPYWMTVGTPRYSAINYHGDVDLYRINLAQQSRIRIRAFEDTGNADPNLNVRLTIRNASNQVVAVVNPAGNLRASTTITLPAGISMIQVDGVGEGVYTAYGSQGYYGLKVSWA